MEFAFYLVGGLFILFAGIQILLIRKNGSMSENGWTEIRIIGYKVIDRLMGLYEVENDKEEFINYVIRQIHEEIVECKALTDMDKNFWTESKLKAIFAPVLRGLIAKHTKK